VQENHNPSYVGSFRMSGIDEFDDGDQTKRYVISSLNRGSEYTRMRGLTEPDEYFCNSSSP
jgi:hypothetical protein